MKKNYTAEFKAKVVMELFREELTLGQLAAGYGIHPNQVSKWRKTVTEGLPELLADRRKKDKMASEHEELTKDLYAQIGELTTKLAWLKKKSGIEI
jgi:transposase-like protein